MKNLKQLLMKKRKYENMREDIRVMKSSDQLSENNEKITDNSLNA